MTEASVADLVERQLEVASLSGEVHAVMAAIVDRLLELRGADGACLSTIDGVNAHFKVAVGADLPLLGRTIPLVETLGVDCLRAGDVVVLRGGDDAAVERSLTPDAGTIVLVPVSYDGGARGILGVRSPDPGAFDEHDVETVRLLGRAAAVAVRNAELVERLVRSERAYRELHAQAPEAMLVTDREGAILEANEAAAKLLGRSPEELRGRLWASLVAEESLAETPLRLDELRSRRELRGERPFVRSDGTTVDVEYSCRLLDDGRTHTLLRDVTQRRRDEERLRSTLGRLHAIVQTQREISELELDPDAVTTAIVERTQRLTGADGVVVHGFNERESVYRFASGIAAGHIGLRLDRGKSLVGAAALLGEVLHASDTELDPRVDHSATRQVGARSLICAPLHRGDVAVGALVVLAREPGAFDELAVETTRLMAEFVSTVMRNASELEARRLLVDDLRLQGQVVEHMQTSLWVWALEDDGAFRLAYANAASERSTGRRRVDVVGLTLAEILPAAEEAVQALFHRVLETGEFVDAGEIEYGDQSIAPSVFSMKAFPLTGDRIGVTFENVTERARASRALQESEARFRGAFHSSSVGMALTALDGTFVQVNDRLAEMLGYETDELARLSVRDITHPDDIELDLRYAVELREGVRDSYSREKRYVAKDGTIVWGELTVSVVRDYNGEPTHVVSHVQDITDRKEANLLFGAIFERSILPKVILDDTRRIVDANGAATELVGLARDDVLGLTIDDLLPGSPVARLWQRFVSTGTMEAEASLRRPDGHERIVEFAATANVRPGRHIAVVRDLTKQKELEEQLRQAQKMEAVGRLAGGIAHDFNNLLTAIAGYSDFLIDGIEDDRLRRHAEEIRKASARAAALTGQLLAFSRRQVLQPRVLDLNDVVSDMDMMLRRLIGEDVELVALLEPALGAVRADPTQIEQVIVNLAVNARDAMPNGGSVTIETANVEDEHGAFVELRLTDTGVGMSDEQRRRLFDPFFTTKAGGTGLGLATVYGIVDQSGGTIEVESSLGLGSSFRIRFPRVAEPAERTRELPAPGRADQGTETILLVEDEAVVRSLVAEILESSGYTVLQAADGPSALELLRRHAGDVELLVTDVVMPGMSGREVAQAVTSMRPGTHVLYTSGYTDSAIGHHGVLEPGIAFLQKPFSADDLTRKVRSLLDESVQAEVA